jgi:hypothetical protein
VRNLPKRAYVLAGALVLFMVVVGGVLAWASISGRAGSQRGFVIHSEVARDLRVEFEDGRSAIIGPSRRESTFVVKRDEFPQVLRVTDPQAGVLFEKRFAYDELADADFRWSFDERGFYPTQEVREAAA